MAREFGGQGIGGIDELVPRGELAVQLVATVEAPGDRMMSLR